MKYTIDNPLLIDNLSFWGNATFTGVAKNTFKTLFFYKNGLFHNDVGAAIVWLNGKKEWWIDGVLYGCNDDFTDESWMMFLLFK